MSATLSALELDIDRAKGRFFGICSVSGCSDPQVLKICLGQISGAIQKVEHEVELKETKMVPSQPKNKEEENLNEDSHNPFHLKHLENVPEFTSEEVVRTSIPMLQGFLDLPEPKFNERGQLILMKHPAVLKIFIRFLTRPLEFNPPSVEVAVKRAYNVLNLIKSDESHIKQFIAAHSTIFMEEIIDVIISSPKPFNWLPEELTDLNYNFYHIKEALHIFPKESKVVESWMMTTTFTQAHKSSPPIYYLLPHLHHQPVTQLIMYLLFERKGTEDFVELEPYNRLQVGFVQLVVWGIFDADNKIGGKSPYYDIDDWVELLSSLIAQASKYPRDPFFEYLHCKDFHNTVYDALTSGKREERTAALTLLLNIDWQIAHGLGNVKEMTSQLLKEMLATFCGRGLGTLFNAVYKLDEPTGSDSDSLVKEERMGELPEGPRPYGHSSSDGEWFIPLTLNRLNFMLFFVRRVLEHRGLDGVTAPFYPLNFLKLSLEWFFSSNTSTIFRNIYFEFVKKLINGMDDYDVNGQVLVFLLVDCRAVARSLHITQTNSLPKNVYPLFPVFTDLLLTGYHRFVTSYHPSGSLGADLMTTLSKAYDSKLFTESSFSVDLDTSVSELDDSLSSVSKWLSSPHASP